MSTEDKTLQDYSRLMQSHMAALTYNARLREALEEAATSLETLSRLAGKKTFIDEDGTRQETYLDHFDQVRGYANSRAFMAREALNKVAEQTDPIQPSSQKTLALALEGKELHDYNAPEYIVCAELIRLNNALSGARTPPQC